MKSYEDMIVFAKGISNGAAAIGTVVGRSEIFIPATDAVLIPIRVTPVACAAALKTLQIHQRVPNMGNGGKERRVYY